MTVLDNFRRQVGRILLSLHSSLNTSRLSTHVVIRNHASFIPKRVLIVSKVSRYQFERIREGDISDDEFKKRVLERGTNYDKMLAGHRKNKRVEKQVIDTLNRNKIDYKVTNRLTIDKPYFDWADLVIAIGGDGTFLLGANQIFGNEKPIFGVNSDPDASEGYLMLEKQYSRDIPRIFELLKAGSYEYVMRTRIRVTLRGEGVWGPLFHMHEKARIPGQEEFTVHKNSDERRLPWLALNEVFIGESLSARTSSLEMKIDDRKDFNKVKCSGLCVSTGTGSSSWYKAINSVTSQMVSDLLRVAEPDKTLSDEQVDRICNTFNDSLQFSPDDSRMSYAIRDIILNDIWPLPKTISPRAYCNSLTIRSQCYDAGLVFDGGIGVPFNVGTVAILETHPEDRLRTIELMN
ncbi:NAD kinase 2, mitochondrial [Diachasmimorpha longicaudata]|uniref:NAD kinase 2, mitochondrial n=1 Tax=Diachasmimorpha longicaudata TaxID=58733 RepID=UPI0030B8C93A